MSERRIDWNLWLMILGAMLGITGIVANASKLDNARENAAAARVEILVLRTLTIRDGHPPEQVDEIVRKVQAAFGDADLADSDARDVVNALIDARLSQPKEP